MEKSRSNKNKACWVFPALTFIVIHEIHKEMKVGNKKKLVENKIKVLQGKKGKRMMANPCKEPPCGEGDMEEIKDLERYIHNSFAREKLRKNIIIKKNISKDGMFCCLSQSFLKGSDHGICYGIS